MGSKIGGRRVRSEGNGRKKDKNIEEDARLVQRYGSKM
jgi:hypothetical protein